MRDQYAVPGPPHRRQRRLDEKRFAEPPAVLCTLAEVAVPSGRVPTANARAGGGPQTFAGAACRVEKLRALATSSGAPLGLLDRVSLRIEEVAATTGLSPSMVRKLIRSGALRAARVGSVPLVLTKDLVTFLEARMDDRECVADGIARELAVTLERGPE